VARGVRSHGYGGSEVARRCGRARGGWLGGAQGDLARLCVEGMVREEVGGPRRCKAWLA
jgi:hypothetical protein